MTVFEISEFKSAHTHTHTFWKHHCPSFHMDFHMDFVVFICPRLVPWLLSSRINITFDLPTHTRTCAHTRTHTSRCRTWYTSSVAVKSASVSPQGQHPPPPTSY